jgi:drug/metabolite transporter (DMT)-like permease
MPNPSRSTLLAACLALVYVVWGSTYLAIHFGLEGLPPLMLSTMRNLCAGTILLAWLFARGAPRPSWRQWRNGVLIGFMMMSLGNGFVCLAEQSVPSGLAALVVGATPVFAILFGWMLGTRPRRIEWCGVAFGLAGLGLLNADLHVAGSPGGFALLVVAMASWAMATILQRRLDMPPAGTSAGVQMVGGGGCLAAMSALRGEHLPAHVPMQSWLALAYLVVFGSIITYTAFVYVISHSRPALATSYAYVNPAVAVGLGVLYAGESVSGPIVAGMAVILAGVGLVMVGSARK